jgi:hypothetical protein
MSDIRYLNNSGSAWVYRPNKPIWIEVYSRDFAVKPEIIQRMPLKFSSFGNHVAVYFKHNGQIKTSLNFSENREALK